MRLTIRADAALAKKTVAIYREQIREDKALFVTGWTLTLISHLCRFVFIPLTISFIIQHLILDSGDIKTPLLLLSVVAVLSLVTTFGNSIGVTKLFIHTMNTEVRLADKAASNLLSQSYEFFSNHKVGSLAGDVASFKRSYTVLSDTLVLQLSSVIVNFVASMIVIGFLSPTLVIPTIMVTAFIVLLSIRSFNGRAIMRRERKLQQSRTNGFTADVLGNSILVKMFANEKNEVKNLQKENQKIATIFLRENIIIRRDTEYRFLVMFIFQALVLLAGILLYRSDLVSIATLVFVVTYFGRINESLFAIAPGMRQIEQAFLDAAPIVEIMTHDPEIQDKSSKTLHVKKGAIAINHVSFSYAGRTKQQPEAIFNDLCLTIKAGERVGLAGHSGGGKTTLTKLLLRFTDISEGEIIIDGQNIADVTQASLRRAIAYVPQEPYLFHRTLRENIAYGKPDATQKQVEDAARKAHAWEFIEKLPQGMDTIVGERGVKLSGGQRQRVAIARAILKDAPILVLDEATSALDSESEKLIQASLENLMKNRTSIVIAHRLSTIAKLDRIIVLEDGVIVEDGTHQDLVAANQTYAKLWRHQSARSAKD